ncbi:hypothetical protein L596_016648 [Steinernema carpocapsae]|uniref:Uncharacterized protein n=1 Tax=Steinernema carpocapsae TaxID=34508 RepID=A0A4U5NJF4_STECR|nr:hypothetical protein L596_016648 [Steinernema carpocapsae]
MDEVQTAADSSSANLDSLWQNDGSLNLSQGQLNLSQSFLDTSLNTSRRRTYVTGGTISKMRNSMSPIGDRSTTQWPSSPKRGDHNKSVEKSFNDSLDFELTSAWNDVAVPDSVIPGLDSVHFDSTFSVAAPVSVQGQLEAVVNRLQKTRPKTLEELRPKLLAIAQKLLPSVEEGHSEAPLAYRNHLEQLGENRLELFDQASNSYDAYIEDLCVDAVRKVLLPGDLKYSAPLIRCARSFPRTEEELVALFEAQLEGKLSILRSNYTERLSSSKRGDRVFIEKHKNRPAEDRFVLDVLMPETFGSIERKVQDAMVASFSEDSELTNTDTSSQARD